nr:immunoglobulin heavy chain junction region [Mus musculus]NSM04530.1 immunoglobulin heavy chain junction region [Mus musculus]NSM04924.1 immunoglobulin heavy chain junction region [Mus musculus]NSM05590.1 immunoglobulin heavy chain junction region [Mus musculus]NSM06024.1 immunoglobulin heavy chain junction region [Mus musculus]
CARGGYYYGSSSAWFAYW